MSTRSTRSSKKVDDPKKNPPKKDESDEEEDEKPVKGGKGAAAKKAADKKKEKEEQTKKKNEEEAKKAAKDDEDEKEKPKKATKLLKKTQTDDKKADDKKDDNKADDAPAATKKKDTGDKKSTSKPADTPAPAPPKKEDENIVKKVIKGAAPVDDYCTRPNVEVYYTPNKIYSAKLNQANMTNNNNKFYVIQVLKTTGKDEYFCFTRWGRVGVPGQNALKGPTSIDGAVSEYDKKFRDKTISGEYRVLEMDYGNDATPEELDDVMKKDAATCKLPKTVISLVSLIFDMKMINNQMKEIGYDVKKMPLGKLSKDNINKAYGILKELYEKVDDSKKNKQKIEQLCNDFYSYIPHDFGFSKMSEHILDTEKKVKQKLEMIESIQNIQIATKLLEDKKDGDMGLGNQVQANYDKLKCEIVPVAEDKRKIIEQFVHNTHAKTHNQYALKLIDAFELKREGEEERYTKNIPNKLLLWHGSRLTNFVGILSQGLRIAPPEAPVTGYMFGKGVYFADMCSKSANYCFTTKQNSTGLMLLCEVALGEYSDKYYADYYAANLPAGKHSTRGRGSTAPPESSYITIYDDVKVPIGEGAKQVFPNGQMGSLLYNEFIVYDIKQIKMKYLLRLEFLHKY